jgi:hypothetical protein
VSKVFDFDTSPGALEEVSAPHLIRPAATFSPERRRDLPGPPCSRTVAAGRGGEGIYFSSFRAENF